MAKGVFYDVAFLDSKKLTRKQAIDEVNRQLKNTGIRAIQASPMRKKVQTGQGLIHPFRVKFRRSGKA